MFTSLQAALLLFAAGLLSRFTFKWFETRRQIMISWGIVTVYQLALRPAFGWQVSLTSMAVDLLAVTTGFVVMKAALEGRVWP